MKRSKTFQPRILKDLKQYSVKLKIKQRNSKDSNKQQFIPFFKQRKLGRLITENQMLKSKRALSQRDITQKLNFKNFKKLYNHQKKVYEDQITSRTRQSSQKNLINENQWKIIGMNRLSSCLHKFGHVQKQQNQQANINQESSQKNNRQKHILRRNQCCCSNLLIQINRYDDTLKIKRNKCFENIDKYLYKKINTLRPPNDNNPELNTLFEHYVGSTQLNENIRREVIAAKTKKIYRINME